MKDERKIAAFVNREVHLCVSQLIHDLLKLHSEPEEYYEVCYKPDYEGCALENGWNPDESDETAQEFCDNNVLDPEYIEALEHLAVSDWLGEKLSERGEMVAEIHGITVWGRTCSGMAIYCDSVIQDIWRSIQ